MQLSMLREAMSDSGATTQRRLGLVGVRDRELPRPQELVGEWPEEERQSLLLLGFAHDEFLTLLSRSFACIRNPACDGVSASVLESLAMGIPWWPARMAGDR